MAHSTLLTFNEYLKMLPAGWVLEHFLKKNQTPRKIVSSSLIHMYAAAFAQAQSLTGAFKSLDKPLRLTCGMAYLTGESGIDAPEPAAGLDDPLAQSFLVYQAKGPGGEARYFKFNEFADALRPLVVKELLDSMRTGEKAQAGAVFRRRCLNDIAVAAALASQGALKKKPGTGSLLRTESNLLRKLTHDQVWGKIDGTDGISKLLLAYCLQKEILTETAGAYLLNPACFDSWLRESDRARYESLEQFTYAYIGGWDGEIVRDVAARSGGVWLTTAVFPERARKRALEAFKAFRLLGLFELRKHGQETECTGTAETGPDETGDRSVVVLPDFSAILGQEIAPEELFRFARIGRLESLDRVYKGRIDRAVIADSLSGGLDGAEILESLGSWQAPSNVVETVREWIREFSRLYISESGMVVSFDPKTTEQLRSVEPFSNQLEQVRADAVFRIKPGEEERVREYLGKLGFDYRMPGSAGTSPCGGDIRSEPVVPETWTPVVEPPGAPQKPAAPFKGTKYGAELKELDINEMIHVIDYAMLTGQKITIEYEGSPYIKAGIYSILPRYFQKGIDPVLDAEVTRTRSRKQFYVRKVKRIGVAS